MQMMIYYRSRWFVYYELIYESDINGPLAVTDGRHGGGKREQAGDGGPGLKEVRGLRLIKTGCER